MADLEGIKVEKNYHLGEAFATKGNFHVKGMANQEWGIKKRLSNIFNPRSGNTVMFAFDHGYFMG
ncbi:MAG: 3-hydroxy-5-phosphonooxypentane-2,4-dione thiolase LsrF, partial [Spirochaetaceae bacterium]|nr:3-hydroxy-5-phosphonooxypentane-2,4-dione thiolase LsrF [Spirochaetaceae bacterium]